MMVYVSMNWYMIISLCSHEPWKIMLTKKKSKGQWVDFCSVGSVGGGGERAAAHNVAVLVFCRPTLGSPDCSNSCGHRLGKLLTLGWRHHDFPRIFDACAE